MTRLEIKDASGKTIAISDSDTGKISDKDGKIITVEELKELMRKGD